VANSCLHINGFEIQKMTQIHSNQKIAALPPPIDLVQEDVTMRA
jgi:hypothetical protein